MRLRVALCLTGLCVGSFVVGCGGDDTVSAQGGDSGADGETNDASGHPDGTTASDGSMTSHDGGDAAEDTGTDAGDMDSGTDTGTEASADTGVDSGFDAGFDAGFDTGFDAGPDGNGIYPAPHPPFPLLVAGGSGGVLTAPVIVPIFFPGYDNTTQVKDQLSKMGTVGTFWSDAVSEYGVASYTYGTPVDLTEQSPASIDPGTVSNWITGKLDGTHPEFGTPTSETVYVIYYPSTTSLSGSCSDPSTGHIGYGGYHDVVQAGNGATVAYGVVAECAMFGPITNALDMVTVAGSHEIIESATDTPPGNGYATIDHNGYALDIFLQGNEENGDLCTVNWGFFRPTAAYPYLLQRGWSNKAAAAGNMDPCQSGLSDQPYIGAAPIMPDIVNVQGSSGPGVVIPVGQSKTVDVELWSDAPTAPFTVKAILHRGDTSLGFAWDKTTGVNGDHLKLTITVNSGAGGYETFAVTAQLNGEQRPIWAGVVTN